jgi:hypothetical protein
MALYLIVEMLSIAIMELFFTKRHEQQGMITASGTTSGPEPARGAVGKIKTSTLGRLRDRFFMFWNSEPRSDEKRGKAADAASDYLEFGATVIGSITGYEQVVELLAFGKQLLRIRESRKV